MDEPIEVEAKPIDQELDTMSKAYVWLADASERVSAHCEQHKPPKHIKDAKSYALAKDARSDCRKVREQLDGERKQMLKDVEDRLKKFKESVKDVLSPLDDLDSTYKRLLTEFEDGQRQLLIAELEDEYARLAPALVEYVNEETGEIHEALVPFDRVLEKYGYEVGRGWLNKTTGIVKAKEYLADAVHDIQQGEYAIDSLVDEEDREEAKALFFETLDQDVAIEAARQLKAKRERVRLLEYERELHKAEELEAEKQEEAPQEQPVRQNPNADVPHAWVISVPCATKQQMLMVADFMRSQGVEFERIYSGTLVDAFRKGVFNA